MRDDRPDQARRQPALRVVTHRAVTRRELLVMSARLSVGAAAVAGTVVSVPAMARSRAGSPRGSTDGAVPSTAVASSPAAAPAAVASAGLLITRPAGDRGAIDDMLAALERAGTDLGLATSVVTVTDPAAHEAAVRRLAQSGADIVAVTFEAADEALGAVAAEFPGTRFIGIGGGAGAAPLHNVVTVTFETDPGAYLVGVLLGHATLTRQLGYLGGVAGPVASATADALAGGAAAVDPGIVVTSDLAGSVADAGAGRLAADRLYGSGVDLLLADAGASDLGAVAAALAAGGYLVAGSESMVELAPASVVATLAVLYGQALYEQLRFARDPAYAGGQISSGIADGMIDLIVSDRFLAEGPVAMAERIRDAAGPMDDARQAIIAGSLVAGTGPA